MEHTKIIGTTYDHPLQYWIDEIYRLDPLEDEFYIMEKVRIIIGVIEDAFLRFDLDRIDDFLHRIDFSVSSSQVITSCLRSSSRAKNHLPHWRGKYEEGFKVIDSRGLIAKHILRGLDQGLDVQEDDYGC